MLNFIDIVIAILTVGGATFSVGILIYGIGFREGARYLVSYHRALGKWSASIDVVSLGLFLIAYNYFGMSWSIWATVYSTFMVYGYTAIGCCIRAE